MGSCMYSANKLLLAHYANMYILPMSSHWPTVRMWVFCRKVCVGPQFSCAQSANDMYWLMVLTHVFCRQACIGPLCRHAYSADELVLAHGAHAHSLPTSMYPPMVHTRVFRQA